MGRRAHDEDGGPDGPPPSAADGVVEFGFAEAPPKELTGRRLKRFKEQKKKMKTGTFGGHWPEGGEGPHEVHAG